jgi:proteasome beta subunit
MDGDFLKLLPEQPLLPSIAHDPSAFEKDRLEATTVFAFHYRQGVLMAGDHRATAGNMIFSDVVDKILPLDSESIMAIAGSPAMALEMARTLETSFEFYRRSQLQTMSLQAKTRAVSRLLKDNLPLTLQGIGTVVPIFAGVDRSQGKPRPAIYFYDPLGAQFETASYAASGSGSLNVKSILAYQEKWGSPRPQKLDLKQATVLALRLLTTAAKFDSATGGVDPHVERYASIYSLRPGELRKVTGAEQASWWEAANKGS